SLRHSHPEWLVRRWLDRLGRDECEALLAKNNEPPVFSVRANTLKQTRDELIRILQAEGLEAEPSPVAGDGVRLALAPSLGDLQSFREGRFFVQDDSSQLVTQVLDPKPGEIVLDVCAGLGGKSTHLAARMRNQGRVFAIDLSSDRFQLLKENAKRLDVHIVRPLLLDARKAAEKFERAADRIVVDAPCSGLGVLRRRPDIRWSKRETDVKRMSGLQREILDGAAPCLKPGGVLIYSTCTTEPEENEDVVDSFLARHPGFAVEPVRPPDVPGAVSPRGFVKLWPHRHGTDGFFIARLKSKIG
ncbi:MAG: 16S rRNA (cytosine(967)-C(5))-methyltransferase RsmB, partial [Elusimicrobia bacterium]|nr:16S rRNA (cytosine(967)-C(5))-methyltransferase RsmB [Elusimicrobiota bacterium]